MNFSLCLFLVLLQLYSGDCCIGLDGSILIDPDGTIVDPIAEIVGDDVVTDEFNNDNYIESGGGPVSSGQQLNCDFESECCWVSVSRPEDQLDWQMARGPVDIEKIVQNLGVTANDAPRGNFLLVSNQARPIDDAARFVSCSVECAQGEIQVSLRHWASSGLILQVCQQNTFDADPSTKPLINCQQISSRASPGPTSIFLPPGELVDVVIVASGFDAKRGGVAMIDEITVDYEACEPFSEAPPLVCKASCDFEFGSLCQFKEGVTSEVNSDTPFAVKKGRFQNRVTGVSGAGEGQSYAAAYLYPGETAVLESPLIETTEDYVLKFSHYEATFQIYTKIFVDDIESRQMFTTDPEVTKKDRQWKSSSVRIPAGTTKVIFMSMNVGSNQGAAAIDNIRWLNTDNTLISC